MAITRKRISRRKFIAAAGAVLGAVAITGCSLTNDRPLGSLPTVTLTLANTAPPTPSATVTPIPETATPSPTPKPTETPTIEPTATKEVMAIQVGGLTPESREDIAEGKLELDPRVGKQVYESLITAFLNDGDVNKDYFNKHFPGSLSNYPEFMRQLKKKDYQMPAGLKIPRPVGYDYHSAVSTEIMGFKLDTIKFALLTISQTEVRMALPDGDPRKLGRDEILSGTTPATDIHALRLIDCEDSVTRMEYVVAAGRADEMPNWTMFPRLNGNELTTAEISILSNWVGQMPVLIKGMKHAETSFIYGAKIKYAVVMCFTEPNAPNCRRQHPDNDDLYDEFQKDGTKMMFIGLFKLAGSGN